MENLYTISFTQTGKPALCGQMHLDINDVYDWTVEQMQGRIVIVSIVLEDN